ncbi:MAG: SRPBCC domain-containing protein [Bacteroidetes bacterium]|nr:SRPBCC domain-containing protein [Bacteroidota bacterium]
MKRIECKITIAADINKVWDAMVATQKYPDWNPFIISVASSAKVPVEGTEMEFTVRWNNGSTQKTKEVVSVFSPPNPKKGETQAVWGYYFKSFLRTIGMVQAVRMQVLSSMADGLTYYHTYEDFRGWGTLFLPDKKIKDGFMRKAQALKKYCEGE